MRLIDAKAGKKLFCAIAKPAEYKGVIHMVVPISEIDKLPTVDAVEVVHGRWMEFNTMMTCSVCDKDWYYDDNNCDEFNYCPNCGAMMDYKGE